MDKLSTDMPGHLESTVLPFHCSCFHLLVQEGNFLDPAETV